MVGRELGTLYPKRDVEPGEEILAVKHLTRRGVFEDVSFQVRRGEILGFAGLVGAGRTEIARVIFGIDRADAGEIRISGKRVQINSPKAAMHHGIAYVPEDRREHVLHVRGGNHRGRREVERGLAPVEPLLRRATVGLEVVQDPVFARVRRLPRRRRRQRSVERLPPQFPLLGDRQALVRTDLQSGCARARSDCRDQRDEQKKADDLG